MQSTPPDAELLSKMDAYWRAANYLSVGQIYLYDNPLLKEPLELEHIKRMLLGHWGTTPGQNFIYVHLNRIIKQLRSEHDLLSRARAWRSGAGRQYVSRGNLQRDLSGRQPGRSGDAAGCSGSSLFPAGSRATRRPRCPGSIHEGGELGYSLSHAFGAVFDNPDLIVACVVGDGEAETGPLATAGIRTSF